MLVAELGHHAVPAGLHTIMATVPDGNGGTVNDSVAVTVVNDTAGSTLTITGCPMAVSVTDDTFTIEGTGFAPDAVVTLSNGKGKTPSVTGVTGSETWLTVTVVVEAKGPGGPGT